MANSASAHGAPKRSKPWVMRTYSGHSSAKASNELYKTNLQKGQTGLSIAFDLPTQIGLDPDHPDARGEVGKVGVPVVHLGHMHQLFDGIPIEDMNTSMTINATSPWLLGLYLALARERGIPYGALGGTTQNDIIKEYLSRGTFIFPPLASRRLTVDMIAYTVANVPKWNPINVCSYHLQEAGATPVQEVAYALATAVSVVDAVLSSGQVEASQIGSVVGRISFFCNAGIRFVEETAKMRAFTKMWDEITKTRYGIEDPTLRRFRYGVQVNSLGLTEQQPENNIARIVLEALGVTLSKDARARAVQLPAWNEAIGLPRPWDQQWSLRIQQILAFETDLLEYPDLFEGSRVMEAITDQIIEGARKELDEIIDRGGAFEMIEELKSRLVRSQSDRTAAIESGELMVIGVNSFTETEPSPLTDGTTESHLVVDPAIELELQEDVQRWRASRDQVRLREAEIELREATRSGRNIMEPTIAFALAGGTTGEWGQILREQFGEFRAPTGISGGVGRRSVGFEDLRRRSQSLVGGPPKLLIAKPGLDGHSNGAEQIAVAARDGGFEVLYQGIRQSPKQIATTAQEEDVDVVGVSILSGSHRELLPEIVRELRLHDVLAPVIVGGIIPSADEEFLITSGVAAIYTPKDFQISKMLEEILDLVARHRANNVEENVIQSPT